MSPIVFLPLSQGQVAIIDFSDFEKVGRFKWNAIKARGKNFYAVRGVRVAGMKFQKRLWLHCEILGIKGVDHKSGNGLDCRRENLRSATIKENLQGFQQKRIGASSRFRGVHWVTRDSTWRTHIRVAGNLFHLGHFKDELDAARAYDVAANKFGFAKEALNFR